jgi:CshA-type fibril repeat protein
VGAGGTVTFTPEPAFTGTASLPYQVADSAGNATSSTVAVTIVPVAPVAADDAATTPSATPVLVPVLANDAPGAPSAPLDPATVALLDPATGQPTARVVAEGQGTWTVTDAGALAFTPAPGFAGATAPVTYRVADRNGTVAAARAVVTVGAGPTAQPDAMVGAPGQPVVVPVLGNDDPSEGATWRPETLCLVDGDDCVLALVVEGEGTWTVGDDGTLTFLPEPGFLGTSEVDYEITDTLGNVTRAAAAATIADDVGTGGGREEPVAGDPPRPSGGLLSRTGARLALLLAVGLALLATGTLVRTATRRRLA